MMFYTKKTQRAHKLQSNKVPTQALTAQRASNYTSLVHRNPNKDPINKPKKPERT
jgi:hypothetical protein